jgi:hypothetical protein
VNTATEAAPIYAVVDRRTDSGKRRILAEFREPEAAKIYADTLRAVGDAAEIVLLSQIEHDD